jgi:hypothetical protein
MTRRAPPAQHLARHPRRALRPRCQLQGVQEHALARGVTRHGVAAAMSVTLAACTPRVVVAAPPRRASCRAAAAARRTRLHVSCCAAADEPPRPTRAAELEQASRTPVASARAQLLTRCPHPAAGARARGGGVCARPAAVRESRVAPPRGCQRRHCGRRRRSCCAAARPAAGAARADRRAAPGACVGRATPCARSRGVRACQAPLRLGGVLAAWRCACGVPCV